MNSECFKMNLHEDEVPVAVGRGRGRGRGRGGGTAILPQGIWNEIVVNRDEDDEDTNDFEANNRSESKDLDDRVREMEKKQQEQEEEQDHESKYDDATDQNANSFDFIKLGFGGRSGVGRGKGGELKGQGGLGPGGVELNKKGIDWNCPSCGNLNWSWRTNCNKCNAGRANASFYINVADFVTTVQHIFRT